MKARWTIGICLGALFVGAGIGAGIATSVHRKAETRTSLTNRPISQADVDHYLCSALEDAIKHDVDQFHITQFVGLIPSLDTDFEGDRSKLEKLELSPDKDHPTEKPDFKAASGVVIWCRPNEPDGRVRFVGVMWIQGTPKLFYAEELERDAGG